MTTVGVVLEIEIVAGFRPLRGEYTTTGFAAHELGFDCLDQLCAVLLVASCVSIGGILDRLLEAIGMLTQLAHHDKAAVSEHGVERRVAVAAIVGVAEEQFAGQDMVTPTARPIQRRLAQTIDIAEVIAAGVIALTSRMMAHRLHAHHFDTLAGRIVQMRDEGLEALCQHPAGLRNLRFGERGAQLDQDINSAWLDRRQTVLSEGLGPVAWRQLPVVGMIDMQVAQQSGTRRHTVAEFVRQAAQPRRRRAEMLQAWIGERHGHVDTVLVWFAVRAAETLLGEPATGALGVGDAQQQQRAMRDIRRIGARNTGLHAGVEIVRQGAPFGGGRRVSLGTKPGEFGGKRFTQRLPARISLELEWRADPSL